MNEHRLDEALSSRQQSTRRQCAGAVLLVRPAAFEFNPETAATNKMQQVPGSPAGPGSAASLASGEFEGLVTALQSEGIEVCVADDTSEPPKPDAVFPNNWVSFHEDGTVVLYPMQAQNRRLERRPAVVEAAARQLGFTITRTVDLTRHENEGRFLEGTGSLVLDHAGRIAYASVSPRTHPLVVAEWCRELGYEAVVFEAADRNGVPLYHTNVLMFVGDRAVIVGSAAIPIRDRARVLAILRASGREIIEIGHDEIARFGGNMLELASWDEALGDCRVIVMSDAARHALAPEAFARLSASTDAVLAVPVPTIERLGGGSVRCMIAEVFLPS